MSNTTHGHTKKPKGRGFQLAHTHSPKKRRLEDTDADASTTSEANVTPTASSSSTETTDATFFGLLPPPRRIFIADAPGNVIPTASSSSSAAQALYIPAHHRLERQDLFREPRDLGSASSSSASVRFFFLFYSSTSRPALTSPYASSHRWTPMTTILT